MSKHEEYSRKKYDKLATIAEETNEAVGPSFILDQLEQDFPKRKDNSIFPLSPILLLKAFMAERKRSNFYAKGQAEALKLNCEYDTAKKDVEEKVQQAELAIRTLRKFEEDKLGMKHTDTD